MTRGVDGVWSVTLSLAPGVYGYKFLVNGSEWIFDPQNPQRKQVNGIDNSSIAITAEASPGALGNSAPPEVSTPPSTPANSSASGVPVTPGEVNEFDVPLSPQQQALSTRGGNPPVTTAHVDGAGALSSALCVLPRPDLSQQRQAGPDCRSRYDSPSNTR